MQVKCWPGSGIVRRGEASLAWRGLDEMPSFGLLIRVVPGTPICSPVQQKRSVEPKCAWRRISFVCVLVSCL